MLASTSILIVGLFSIIQSDARKNQLDLITFFIFLAIPYFGVWPFIVIATSEYEPSSEYSMLVINLITFCSFLGLWLGNKFLKRVPQARPYRALVDLEQFILKVKGTPTKYFIYFEFFLIVFLVYGYLQYGILKSFSFDGMSTIGISLPSWYLAIYASIRMLIFFLVLALSIKHICSSSNSLVLVFGLLIAFAISLLFGRASFIMALSAYFLFYLKIKGRHFLSPKLLVGGIAGLLLVIVSLNFFQHVRSALLSPALLSPGETATSMFKQRLETLEVAELFELTEIGYTLNNRPSVWKFNETIYSWQFVQPEHSNLPYGYLLVNSWLMLVPRTIWPEKPANNMQENVLFPFYEKKYVLFQAPSLLGYVLADFSLLAPIVFPILVLLFLFVVSHVLRVFYSSGFAYMVVFSGAAYNMLSVEANYDSYILVFRNSVFFALLIYGFFSIKKMLKQ